MTLSGQVARCYDDPMSDLVVEAGTPWQSQFDVGGLVRASVGQAGLSLARLAGIQAPVGLKQSLANLWFHTSFQPIGWQSPSIWDPIAGNYRADDTWVRLHTNAAHHRKAVETVLGPLANKDEAQAFVLRWKAADLEAAILKAGGVCSVLTSLEAWQDSDAGRAVAGQPLVVWHQNNLVEAIPIRLKAERPLAGLKVLDLTRVLAGPVATRFLAAYGAEVLRIDPPFWDEDSVALEMSPGKRCACLDLRSPDDRLIFEALIKEADLLVHGYRQTALANLGYSPEKLKQLNPALPDVALNAYGWTGPWRDRRGFDTVVQLSAGLAQEAMQRAGGNSPLMLPVQALDHATGYLMAAACCQALERRAKSGEIWSARLSLARTANLLSAFPHEPSDDLPAARADDLPAARADDFQDEIETTPWGALKRLKFPLDIAGLTPKFARPANRYKSAAPNF